MPVLIATIFRLYFTSSLNRHAYHAYSVRIVYREHHSGHIWCICDMIPDILNFLCVKMFPFSNAVPVTISVWCAYKIEVDIVRWHRGQTDWIPSRPKHQRHNTQTLHATQKLSGEHKISNVSFDKRGAHMTHWRWCYVANGCCFPILHLHEVLAGRNNIWKKLLSTEWFKHKRPLIFIYC